MDPDQMVILLTKIGTPSRGQLLKHCPLHFCCADFLLLCTTLLPNVILLTCSILAVTMYFNFRVRNSVDPDQMASSEAI